MDSGTGGGTARISAEPSAYTGFLIRRAQQVHVATWQREVSPVISSVQFGVLAVLARRPGASQQDLCDEVDLDRSTIADIVRRLETRELIRRQRDAADRRRNQLVLTDHGERVLRDLLPRVERVEHVLTDPLTADERDDLRRLLRKVLRSSGAEADGSAADA